MDKYLSSVKKLELVFQFCVRLSKETQGRIVENRKVEVASQIFTKILLHFSSLLKLVPKSKYSNSNPDLEIWDYTSIAILTRAIIDAYYVMYYLTIDDVDDDENDFRFLVWDYHSENRRLKQLELIGSSHSEIPEIRSDVENLKNEVQGNSLYSNLEKNFRKGVGRGEIPFLLTNLEIAKKAGISEHYHKATYMYLSSYIHTYPYSISQTSAIKNTNQILELTKPLIDYCLGYICLCIRDFMKHVPDQKVYLVKELELEIDKWENIFRNLYN